MEPEEHVVHNSSGNYRRKVWVLDTARRAPAKLGIFLDGEFYVNRMKALALIDGLHRDGWIPPMVFVSHVDGAARHDDLTCNPAYADFIVRDIVRWIQDRRDGITPQENLIVCPSLGGLAAAYIALSRPDTFSCCLSQSGSFWWNEEWLARQVETMPAVKGRFWLSVGRKETESGVSHPPTGLRQDITQIAGCVRFRDQLLERGHGVHYHLYEGGHELGPWEQELSEAMP